MSWATTDDEAGWWTRVVRYGEHVFSARCPECARFVKVDATAQVMVEWGGLRGPNATCFRHGRVETPFLGWASDCMDEEQ